MSLHGISNTNITNLLLAFTRTQTTPVAAAAAAAAPAAESRQTTTVTSSFDKEDLQAFLAMIQDKISTVGSQISKHTSDKQTQEAALASETKRKEELTKQLKKSDEMISGLESKISDLAKQLHSSTSQHESYRTLQDKLRKVISNETIPASSDQALLRPAKKPKLKREQDTEELSAQASVSTTAAQQRPKDLKFSAEEIQLIGEAYTSNMNTVVLYKANEHSIIKFDEKANRFLIKPVDTDQEGFWAEASSLGPKLQGRIGNQPGTICLLKDRFGDPEERYFAAEILECKKSTMLGKQINLYQDIRVKWLDYDIEEVLKKGLRNLYIVLPLPQDHAFVKNLKSTEVVLKKLDRKGIGYSLKRAQNPGQN